MFRVRFVCMCLLGTAVLAGFCESATAAQSLAVTIDAGKTGEPISRFVYGQFIEHLGRCIYGGIWAVMGKKNLRSSSISAHIPP